MLVDIMSWVHVVISIVFIVLLIFDKKHSETALSWIIIIVAVPYIGIIIFIILGTDWNSKKLMKVLPESVFETYFKESLEEHYDYCEQKIKSSNSEYNNDIYKSFKLLNISNNSIVTYLSEYKILNSGTDFFNSLIKDIKNAKKNIHLEYFIWRSDEIGNRIKEELIKKAKQGIKVRLIFDSFGSLGRISRKYKKELKEAGVEFVYFLEMFHPTGWLFRINYRNHRKIVVIDNEISYTGGMNIGNEYATGGDKFQEWRDVNIRYVGKISKVLQMVFLTDWHNSGHEMLINDELINSIKDYKCSDTAPVQVAVNGPDSKWHSIKLLFMNMITNANKKIYIQSPYLVPDQAMLEALEVAALSGVEVNLMMTGLPDKKIPFYAAYTYYEELIDAGVNIYQYMNGFLHNKVIVMDKSIASLGSTNMDIRSFRLSYEINTVVYEEKICDNLIIQFEKDLKNCRKITKDDIKKIGFFKNFRNSLCRILSPLL